MKALRERGLKVVDLSADFRLDQAAYEHWYQPHEAPELLDEAVYGLPEVHRAEIEDADLVAGPAATPPPALLALLPLAGRIEEAAVDIKAGVSGAGREATDDALRVRGGQRQRLQGRGHRHGRARAGAAGRTSASSRTCSDRPGDPGELLRAAVEPITQAEADEL